MDNTGLEYAGGFALVAVFCVLVVIGSRLSVKLEKKSPWLALAVGAGFIAVAGGILFVSGQPLSTAALTAAVSCIGFGGGIVARQHQRVVNGG